MTVRLKTSATASAAYLASSSISVARRRTGLSVRTARSHQVPGFLPSTTNIARATVILDWLNQRCLPSWSGPILVIAGWFPRGSKKCLGVAVVELLQ
jgi:hypothetical protein